MEKMNQRIVIDKEVLAGKPIIRGTRISVEFILELLSSGTSVEEILKEYQHISKEDILAAIAYAARRLKHEKIIFTEGMEKSSYG